MKIQLVKLLLTIQINKETTSELKELKKTLKKLYSYMDENYKKIISKRILEIEKELTKGSTYEIT
jgi:hypothetical protein